MAENQPTAEEILKAKEARREYALRNLGADNLMNLAVVASVKGREGYGKIDEESAELFLYEPSKASAEAYDSKSGEKYNLIDKLLEESRTNGESGTGHITEPEIVQAGAVIVADALTSIKVSDMLEIIGSDAETGSAYKDKYISDLLVGSDEDKGVAQKLIGHCLAYITEKKVLEARETRLNHMRNGLEDLVREREAA